VAYRRGFKSEANTIARQTREELGLRMLDRLDPWLLADHLLVPVIALSDLHRDAPDAVTYLLYTEPEAFSAATVFRGRRRRIIHNDAHTPGRQASDVTHELAHALLQHEPTPALDDRGCRLWNQNIEDEAQWLAGALLITEDAALAIVRNRAQVDEAAERLGVSAAMVTYRINVTGARARVARARRFRIVK
jgi:Zn-dependent peptidase ImmA (M78 family)